MSPGLHALTGDVLIGPPLAAAVCTLEPVSQAAIACSCHGTCRQGSVRRNILVETLWRRP